MLLKSFNRALVSKRPAMKLWSIQWNQQQDSQGSRTASVGKLAEFIPSFGHGCMMARDSEDRANMLGVRTPKPQMNQKCLVMLNSKAPAFGAIQANSSEVKTARAQWSRRQ